MRDVEAIQTTVDGVRYRSRTEARWAIFFSALNLTFSYEPQRLRLSSGETYLPDFYIREFSAWFEVKAANDAIVTNESARARRLAADHPEQRVWLAVGPPSETTANILPLNEWELQTPIEQILGLLENRYRFLQDRRDDEIYWLQADQVTGIFRHSFCIGGPGTSTDHDRLPLLQRRIVDAYEAARTASF